jgi:hypothetical protein
MVYEWLRTRAASAVCRWKKILRSFAAAGHQRKVGNTTIEEQRN